MIVDDELARLWRAARPPVAGVHLDSAACSRQTDAAIDSSNSVAGQAGGRNLRKSPPNEAMLSRTHCKAATMSIRPWLPEAR